MAPYAPSIASPWQNFRTYLGSDLGFSLGDNANQVLYQWATLEKGNGKQLNGWNPLNTELRQPGSTNFNSAGVQNYPSLMSGALATANTLKNYPNIVGMLRSNTPASQWTPQAKYELDTWAHGAGGDHSGKYANAVLGLKTGAPPTISGPQSGINSAVTLSNPLSNPLDNVGAAITSAEQAFVQKASAIMAMVIGAALMIGGLALLAVLALKVVPAPVKDVAGAAASLTPAGRAAGVARAATSKTQQKPNSAPTPSASTAPKGPAPRREAPAMEGYNSQRPREKAS